MSRVGKNPISIPDKTKVDVKGQNVTVTGPKGTLTFEIHSACSAAIEDGQVQVTRSSDL